MAPKQLGILKKARGKTDALEKAMKKKVKKVPKAKAKSKALGKASTKVRGADIARKGEVCYRSLR